MANFPLDSNQPALMTARLGVARLGTFRLGAAIPLRNLNADGSYAWSRVRALKPEHNVPTDSDTWTTAREV